jgi:hypothetical protein
VTARQPTRHRHHAPPGPPPVPAKPRGGRHSRRRAHAKGTITVVGLTNDELTRRYQSGEALDQLADAAEMTLSGVQARLRRLGVPPRRQTADTKPTPKQVKAALKQHQSINATAKALGVTRPWLAAEAQRLDLRHSYDPPADLLERHRAGATQTQLAEHYRTAASTIGHWLHALGQPPPPRGRRPRDG